MTSNEGFKGFVTFTGLVVLIGLTSATILYANKSQNNSSEASTKDIEPRGIEISTSETGTIKVSWSTPTNTLGTFFYSKDQNSKCLTNEASTYDCDFVAEASDKTSHAIELKNLSPNTKYFYKIRINNQMYPANGILMSFVVPEISAPITANETEAEPTTQPQASTITPQPTAALSNDGQNYEGFDIKSDQIEPQPTTTPAIKTSDFEGFN